MKIRKIDKEWYQATEIMGSKIYWGYGHTLEEAVTECVKEMEKISAKV